MRKGYSVLPSPDAPLGTGLFNLQNKSPMREKAENLPYTNVGTSERNDQVQQDGI